MDTAGTWTMYQDADVPSGYGFSKSVSLDVNTANSISRVKLKFVPENELHAYLSTLL